MRILEKAITKEELLANSRVLIDDEMVKAVVDVDQSLLAVDAELHADLETFLLQKGARQESLWGINLYPEEDDDEAFIEFDSMINIRPRQGNRSRGVEDGEIRKKIVETVHQWIR